MTPAFPSPIRATVIIPTYGNAPYVAWALASAQAQTVRELEICVICDGSPPHMVEMLEAIAAEDPRLQIFKFPKAPRTGEIHRAEVIRQTTGNIICYLSHDDLWFPHHVAVMERVLRKADFAHSLHVCAALGAEFGTVRHVSPADLVMMEFRNEMLNTDMRTNYFGLTYGAHTREAYFRLDEGWTVTPDGIWTDLYMWRKFLSCPWCRCVSHMGITALHFERPYWEALFSADGFAQELGRCFVKIDDPSFLEDFQSRAVLKAVSDRLAEREGLRNALSDCLTDRRNEGNQHAAEMQGLYASRSWRITRPLRHLTKLARRFKALVKPSKTGAG